MDMWKQYFIPENLGAALRLLNKFGERARLIAGGTDLVLDFSNGKFPEIEAVVDISCLPELRGIRLEGDVLKIGAAVTLTEIISSELIRSISTQRARLPVRKSATQLQLAGTWLTPPQRRIWCLHCWPWGRWFKRSILPKTCVKYP